MGPFSFKAFVDSIMGKQKGIKKKKKQDEKVIKSPKTLHDMQLYFYLVPRNVDGSFSAPEGVAHIRTSPFCTFSLPYLVPTGPFLLP